MVELGDLGLEPGAAGFTILWVAFGAGIMALLFAWHLGRQLVARDEGTDAMKAVAGVIRSSSVDVLGRQVRVAAVLIVILALATLLGIPAADLGVRAARSLALLLGGVAGLVLARVGSGLTRRGNLRVASASRRSVQESQIAGLRAGGAAGVGILGAGLLAASTIVLLWGPLAGEVLMGFAAGAGTVALLLRVAGGVFAKSVDVGADVAGVIVLGRGEDSPENPAVLADAAGDVVGGGAGLTADLFGSSVVSLCAAMILGALAFGAGTDPASAATGALFPLALRASGLVASWAGIYLVTPRSPEETGRRAGLRGMLVATLFSALAALLLAVFYSQDLRSFAAVLVGLVLVVALQVLADYSVSTVHEPVRGTARAGAGGAAGLVTSGLAIGLEATVLGLAAMVIAVVAAYSLGGDDLGLSLYYVSLAALALLTPAGLVTAVGLYGPVVDSARVIASFAGDLGERAAWILPELDVLGRTSKAASRDVALAAGVLAGASALAVYWMTVPRMGESLGIVAADVRTLVGLVIGFGVPFLATAMVLRGIQRGAAAVEEGVTAAAASGGWSLIDRLAGARRSVEIAGVGTREMVGLGVAAALAPVAVGFGLRQGALAAYLVGTIVSGQLLALLLIHAGGAWDSVRRAVEQTDGNAAGSLRFTAAAVGDAVGDPLKDAAGPMLGPLVMTGCSLAVLVAPAVVDWADAIAIRAVVGVTATALALGGILWSRMGGRS